MKKLLLLPSLFFAVALCTNLQASDGDTKRNVELTQTEKFERSNGKNERALWKKYPKLEQQRTRWIAGFDLEQQEKPDASLTSAENQSVTRSQRLPTALQFYIFDCAHGDANYRLQQAQKKYVGENMQKLIPALMHWPHLFNNIDATDKFCSAGDINVPRCDFFARFSNSSDALNIKTIDELSGPMKSNKNSFGAGRFADRRTVFFKVPGCQLKRLLQSDPHDLQFIVKLFDQQKAQIEKNNQIIRNNLELTRYANPGKSLDESMTSQENLSLADLFLNAQVIKPTPPEKQHLDALAAKDANMAENLRKNYEIE